MGAERLRSDENGDERIFDESELRRNGEWDFDGGEISREDEQRLGARILEVMDRPEEELGAERTEWGWIEPEPIEEVETTPDENERGSFEALEEIRESWGVSKSWKSEDELEFEQKMSWEEFQRRAEEAWQAGQESDFAREDYVSDWQDDIDERDEGIDWMLPYRLKDYDMAKRFGEMDGRMNLYADVGVTALFLGLLEDEYSAGQDDPVQQKEEKWQADPYALHFSYDKFDAEGERISGFAEERPGDERPVTMVIDAGVKSDAWFEPGTKYPTMRVLSEMHRHLEAVVAKDAETYTALKNMKVLDGIPVFTVEEWREGGEELADKVREEHKVRAEEFYEKLREERQRKAEEEKVRKAQLAKEVFDEVNIDEVKELTRSYAEKVDPKMLEAIRNGMELDMDSGAQQMVGYMASILNLKEKPKVMYVNSLGDGTRGDCTRKKGGDLVRLSKKFANQYNVYAQMGTLAHECWHSYQHMVSGVEEGTVQQDRREQYEYNFRNYVQPEQDFETYRKQLVEVEAREFAAAVQEKIEQYKPDEEKLEREVFTDVDMKALDKAVREELSKVSAKDFLAAIGVKNLEELKQRPAGEVTERALSYFNQALGIKEPITLRAEDWSKNEERAENTFGIGSGELLINEAKTEPFLTDIGVGYLIHFVWWLDRKDFLQRKPYDGRGELYNYNFDHYVVAEDDERHRKQILTVEGERFRDEFLEELKMEGKGPWKKVLGKGKKLQAQVKRKLGLET